jgi:hypothetical protein
VVSLRLPAVFSGSVLLLSSVLPAQLPAYNPPDDPAFVFLGVTPKRIGNPGTLPALGLALAEGIDVDGRVLAGLAVSFLPSSLARYSLPAHRYRNGRPAFWIYNTQISVGTARHSGDVPATDLAFGLKTILLGPEPYSSQEFRNSIAAVLDRCLTRAQGVDTSTVVLQHRTGVRAAPVRDSTRPTRILGANGGVVARQDTARMWTAGPEIVDREVALECGELGKIRALKAWMNDHWNDATLAISAATGTRFERAAVSRRASLGRSVWLVGAVPIRWTRATTKGSERTNLGQIAAQLHHVTIPGGAGGIDDSSWEGGVRAMAGRSTINGFIELSRNLAKSDARASRSAWAGGIEWMVAQSVWLSAGVGERYAELLDRNRDFTFLNLKWAIARAPQLGR